MKKAYGIMILVGMLAMSAHTVLSWVGTRIETGGGPDLIGIGFFAACLAICLPLFQLLVRHLKRRCGPRLTGGTIPYLPFSESFHLADSGVTIGRRPSVLERERDAEPTFRPFSFP